MVGLSGAGKSTLIRAVNGLVPLTSGQLTVNGRDVVGAGRGELRELRGEVGMIFQSFNLVKRSTVMRNVLMGRLHAVPTWRSTLGLWSDQDKERAFRALERVEIVDKAWVAGVQPVGRAAAARLDRAGAGPGADGDAGRRAGRLAGPADRQRRDA